ncbi:hypothetical protein evm_012630 [Chilo suppressalis]|nr:hypothetical protein evm_012630 [Chilo suppressalis]
MARNLTIEERKQIIDLNGQGKNISEISRELKISRETVRRWVQRDATEGSIQNRPRVHLAPIMTFERVTKMLNIYKDDPYADPSFFAIQFDCSVRSIKNALNKAGLHHKRLVTRKIKLTTMQKEIRLHFARDFEEFDFSAAIFSDKKCFQLIQDGPRNTWRLDCSSYEPKITDSQSGKVIVCVWGWMSADGPGELVAMDGKLSGQGYRDLLDEIMLPTVRTVYPTEDVPVFAFFQYNPSIDRARVVQDWFNRRYEVKSFSWPSRSPDLNPIEHLWDIIAIRWDSKNEPTKAAVIAHCEEIWDSFRGTDICQELVESMPKRCAAIIEARGASTEF